MADIDPEILAEFKTESENLIAELTAILEECEGNYKNVKKLEQYGQIVDRIMGGAQTLAMQVGDSKSVIHRVGDYAAICKTVGYKASQIIGNQSFYDVCVAFLLDATELLQELIESLEKPGNIKDLISNTFLERLRWVSSQFSAEVRSSVAVPTAQKPRAAKEEIDELLRKMGLT